jgi:signal transduction histidine kinase
MFNSYYWNNLYIFAVVMKIKILIFCLIVSLTAEAYNDYRNARVDSLEAALKSKNPPKGDDLLRAYDELMRGYLPFDSEKAVEYGRKALALSYIQNGLNIRQNVLRHFGLMYYGREEFGEALRYFNHALAVVDTMATQKRYTQKDLDDARSCIYGAIANVYNIQDKHHLAIHYYQLALPIFEKYNWLESQTVLYHNIGELYFTMGNLQKAEHNYELALKKSEASGDSLMMALAHKGLLHLYVRQDNYEKAHQIAPKCYEYYHAHRTEEAEDYPVVLASMARLNMMEGHKDLSVAQGYAEEAASLADSLVFENQSEIFATCAELAMAEHQWQKALSYALRTIRPDSLATSADASCYRLLAEIYTQLGQKDKACLYISKMYDTMTRYATDHYQSGLSQMEVLYETEKKEAQILQLASERRQHMWLLTLAAALLVAMGIGYCLLIIIQRRKKALLAAKVALEAETKERRILARDLHDGLGGMLSLLRMKTEQGEPSLLPLIDSIHTELRRTAHHLMPEELLKNGLVSALHDFAVSLPNTTFQHIIAEGVTTPLALRRGAGGEAIELVLYRCAYELVNNAIKHAKAEHISIQLMQEPQQVTLTVSDDGKGMQDSKEGMGLQNIRERIMPYHGSINIASVEGQGTDINITLPL